MEHICNCNKFLNYLMNCPNVPDILEVSSQEQVSLNNNTSYQNENVIINSPKQIISNNSLSKDKFFITNEEIDMVSYTKIRKEYESESEFELEFDSDNESDNESDSESDNESDDESDNESDNKSDNESDNKSDNETLNRSVISSEKSNKNVTTNLDNTSDKSWDKLSDNDF